MTHDEAFLQAITETPDDDTPRLIYADWLDDQGHSDRAEFIRLQCRLAEIEDEDPHRPALAAQEQDLLERCQDDWLGPLRPLLCRWTFRRGFLEAIAVPARLYLETPAIADPATVRRFEVDLTGFEVPQQILECVPESIARENIILPLGICEGIMVMASQDSSDVNLLEKLEFIFNRSIVLVAAPPEQIRTAIERYYDEVGPGDSLLCSWVELDTGWNPPVRDEETRPIAKLISLMIHEAIPLRASVIRIEPRPDRIDIRYRVGYRVAGRMVERDHPHRRFLVPIVRYIRVVAAFRLKVREERKKGASA